MTEQEHFNTSARVELYEAEVGQDQQRMLIKEPLEVESTKIFYVLYAKLKLTDAWEVVRDTRFLFCMEKRQNHVRMNSEGESERSLREPWQEKPG